MTGTLCIIGYHVIGRELSWLSTPEAWWFDAHICNICRTSKPAQSFSRSFIFSFDIFNSMAICLYISKLLANFPVTYNLCPTTTTQGWRPNVSILVVQDTSLLRASWTWRVQGIGVVAEPRPDRFRQEGGWKVGAKKNKICRNFLGKFRQQKWVKEKNWLQQKKVVIFFWGKVITSRWFKKLWKKNRLLARRVSMQLSRNNVRPVTSNASRTRVASKKMAVTYWRSRKKKGVWNKMPSGKKTTWSVIWWLRLVAWGQSFFKNIQQIRTIGSTKKQLFGCYNSLTTSLWWLSFGKQYHVVGGLRKQIRECWKTKISPFWVHKQTKNGASVLLEDVSLHVPEEVTGLISANFKN